MSIFDKVSRGLVGVFLAVATVVVVGSGSVSAAQDVCVWTGAASGDASNAANWTGCDNSNLPETGDDLNMQSSATTYGVNWDLAIIPRHISLQNPNYSFNGDPLTVSGTINIYTGVQFNNQVTLENSTGQTGINMQGSGGDFDGGIVLNVTGSGFVSVFTTNATPITLPAFSGTATDIYLNGNPLAPVETYILPTGATFTVSGGIHVGDAIITCQSSDCLGNSANSLELNDAGSTTFSQLTIDTPSFDYDVTTNNYGNTDLGQRIRFAQNSDFSGNLTSTTPATINVDSGVTAMLSGNIDNVSSISLNGAGSTVSSIQFEGVTVGGAPLSADDITVLFNGTNTHAGSYINANDDSFIGGTGEALSGINTYSGSTVSPGTSPGCLESGFYTGSDDGVFVVEITGTAVCSEYDRLTLSGSVAFNSVDLDLDVTGGPYALGTVFTIIQADSLFGTFDGLADGATIEAGGNTFRVNYTGAAVTLTIVEAPIDDETDEDSEEQDEAEELADTGSPATIVGVVAALLLALGLVAFYCSRNNQVHKNQTAYSCGATLYYTLVSKAENTSIIVP